MKAEEMMLYDWFLCFGKPTHWEAQDFQKSDEFIAEHYKPIELTPEILEKNGWKWRTKYDIKSLKLFSKDGHCLMTSTYGNKISVGGNNIEMKYVHSLQHALRLCGLEELADSIKI